MVRIPVYTQDPVNVTPFNPYKRLRDLAYTALPCTIQAPAGTVWDVRSICIRLATDANVANRQIILRMDAPNIVNPVFSEPYFTCSLYQPASVTRFYSWAKGVDYSVRTGTSYDGETAPLPDCVLEPLMSYQFGIENGQVGDVSTIIVHLYESEA